MWCLLSIKSDVLKGRRYHSSLVNHACSQQPIPVSDGAPQFASSERSFFSNSDNNRGNWTLHSHAWLSHRRVAFDQPTRRTSSPHPGPLGSPLLVPLNSFRPDQPFLIKIPNFSEYFLFLFFCFSFRVSGFWFLVFGVGSAAAHFKSVQLLRGRVSSQEQGLQLLTSKRFTAQLPPVHPLTHHNDSPKRRYQGHPVLHPWPIC